MLDHAGANRTLTPPVLLVHSRSRATDGFVKHLHDLLPHAQVISVAALPGPMDVQRDAAVTIAAGLAHRGVVVIVHGDIGNATERAAFRLRLHHEGIFAAVLDEESRPDALAAFTAENDLTSTAGRHKLIEQLLMGEDGHRQIKQTTMTDTRYAVLVRHGQASYASEGFPSDDELTLDSDGQAQVYLAGTSLLSYAPTVIYCSTLLRARQTAAILAEFHQPIEIVYDARLNEREFTPLHGLNDRRITELYGEHFLRTFTSTPDDTELVGVQTLSQCQARVVDFFNDLANSDAERPLIVAHGGPFAWLASHLMELPLAASRRWHMRHAAISTIAITPPMRLVSWNARTAAPEALTAKR